MLDFRHVPEQVSDMIPVMQGVLNFLINFRNHGNIFIFFVLSLYLV